MFNGFPSTNTPAIQVWDFYNTSASSGSTRAVSLADDCAPIQYFRTGANSTAIRVNFPLAPPDGKIIKIVNQAYRLTSQLLNVYFSDASDGSFYTIGAGQTIDFCYSKFCNNLGSNGGFSTGWICLNQASANNTGYNSVNLGGTSNAAYGTNSVTIGGNGSSASNLGAGVFAGASNAASGQYGVVAGGNTNTASSTNSAVLGGTSNAATSSNNSVVIGGSSNAASGQHAVVVGGVSGSASGFASVVLGGSGNFSNANSSTVICGQGATTRSINSVGVFHNFNTLGGTGFSQSEVLILAAETTNATVTTLRSDPFAAATTNQLVLPNNSAYYVRGSVIANVTGGGNTKAWSFEAAIKRGVNAASTTLMQYSLNVVASDTGAAAWDITLSADTTNGAFRVQVTGAAATTIRWVCRLDSTEVTY
jgi:hypothetical protein